MSPRPSIADERRPQILEAAARVIASRGLDGLRLSDVAEEGGFSVGTVQHYFGSREALLAAAFRHMQTASLQRWYAVAGSEPDPWRRLISLLGSATSGTQERFRERWTLWLEFWTLCLREPRLRGDSGDLHTAWQTPLLEAIEDGMAAGRFEPRAPLEDVADRAMALMDGLALQLLLEVPDTTRERMLELMVEAIAADLGVDPATGEPLGHAADAATQTS